MKTSRRFMIVGAFVAMMAASDFVASSFGVTGVADASGVISVSGASGDAGVSGVAGVSGFTCKTAAPNTGSYLRTNMSVSVYTENGHPKGSFAVYLHNGKRYIDFNNTWICIQGKRRFSYCGNWYVIK